MDEELAKVAAQIGLLEPQIQAAGESFLSALQSGNQSLAEYWRNEKERLRKKKELLRKEEEQLREQKLILLRSNETKTTITGVSILQVCDTSISTKSQFISRLAPYESVCKAKFPSARTLMCALSNLPCLLWEGVGDGLVELDNRFAQRLSERHTTVLLAPSGSGKTRMLIELACSRFTLFLTGKRPMVGFGGGSNDVDRVARWMETRFPAGEHDLDPNHAVVRFGVGILILVRLKYLKLLKALKPGLHPRDWAFFQLEYPAVDDVFRAAVEALIDCVPVDQQLPMDQLEEVIRNLADDIGWKEGVVVLDEAQMLLRCMKGRFKSELSPTKGQPLLSPMLLALKSYGFLKSCLFVAGTGTNMLKVRERLLGGTVKPFDVREIYSLPGFDDTNIPAFLQRFIDISRLDMPAITSMYTGRRRLLSTAIEKYVVQDKPPEDWFQVFFLELINKTGVELGLLRSLRDEVERVWDDPEAAQMIEDILFTYYLTGFGHVIVQRKRSVMTLVDCGFATLLESDASAGPFAPIIPHIRGVRGDEAGPGSSGRVNVQYVILQEPMIAEALWEHMPAGTVMERVISTAANASVRGITFERFACIVGEAFDNKLPAEVLGLQETDVVYKEEYEVVKPRGHSGVLVQEIQTEEQLNLWVEAVEAGASFATYAWLGPFQEAGPDGMFLLRSKESHKMMPVFLQFRTGSGLGVTQAFSSLDIMKIDKMLHSGGASRKLKQWCWTGYLRLVVSPNPHPRVGKVAFGDVWWSGRARKGHKEIPLVSPLSAVWAGRKLRGIVNTELLDAVEEVKKGLKKLKRG
ncbi:uncharacterized protein LOC112348829 [Selaginella moellendorffii]|uniref:uncharacterized protein LOC112348829 n=1 Tax=Selaginella moellendorffii TaxID=88036 RepID=UPI000D1CC177|nr:uncharacterized protein LOC112348829 [Selaginella moellendorffii]|eukprot:XP_024537828.1 uncharacterized protein LOC112348829 [Selaginella moellendorffii]